jgi:mannose-6-phosphate isomerase-like protein (cupin superfamily)
MMHRTLVLAAGFLALAAAPVAEKGPYQTYPHPDLKQGELLFENDHVVVQRFLFQPGVWEGIHSHPGNQLFIHVRGGEWTVRRGGKEETSVYEDGSVGWWPAIDLSENHESGNTGKTPIDLIWVTLKQK